MMPMRKVPTTFKEARISPEGAQRILQALQNGPKTRYELSYEINRKLPRELKLGERQLNNMLNLLEGVNLIKSENQPYHGVVKEKRLYSLTAQGKETLNEIRKTERIYK
jgi:DNA-binding PadR family transcriptional regulator